MKIALVVFVGAILVAVVAYFLLFPRDTFISLSRPGGGAVTFSRTGACHWRLRPTTTPRMASPTLSRIFRDCLPTNHFKFLHMFTPDGCQTGMYHAVLRIESKAASGGV